MKYAIFALLLLTCCSKSYRINDFEKYKATSQSGLTKEEEAKVVKYKKLNLAITDLDNVGKSAIDNRVGEMVSSKLISIITENNYASVPDRNLFNKLKTELTIAESSSSGSAPMQLPVAADYVITGNVSEFKFYQESKIDWVAVVIAIANAFNGGSNKDQKFTYISSIVDIEMELKLLAVPSLEQKDVYKCKKTVSRQIPDKSSYSTTKVDDLLLSKVIESCTSDIIKQMTKTIIKPEDAIDEKRVFGENAIFKIELGSQNGIKQNQKVNVVRVYDGGERKDMNIKSAYVSDLVTDNTAWIVVTDAQEANNIRVGDIAQINIEYKS